MQNLGRMGDRRGRIVPFDILANKTFSFFLGRGWFKMENTSSIHIIWRGNTHVEAGDT